MVNELPTRLDMGNFPDVIRYLQNQLRDHGRQGSTDMEALDSQFLNVAEEGGEAAGAYRRWRGFARRSGTKEEVLAELADCIISAAVGMIYFCDIADAGAPSVVIQDTLARKLHKIFVRGYVNKEAKPISGPKDNPDAVYVRQPDGTWEYAGQIDSFDFLGLVPPYTITTGRDFCGPFKP
jgi:hypothetical protein